MEKKRLWKRLNWKESCLIEDGHSDSDCCVEDCLIGLTLSAGLKLEGSGGCWADLPIWKK